MEVYLCATESSFWERIAIPFSKIENFKADSISIMFHCLAGIIILAVIYLILIEPFPIEYFSEEKKSLFSNFQIPKLMQDSMVRLLRKMFLRIEREPLYSSLSLSMAESMNQYKKKNGEFNIYLIF